MRAALLVGSLLWMSFSGGWLALAVPPSFVGVALPGATSDVTVVTPDEACASATVVANAAGLGSTTFHARACNVGVNWLTADRTLQDAWMSWNVTTSKGTMHCLWPPNVAAVCDYPAGNVPAVPGGPITITVRVWHTLPVVGVVTFLGPKSL